MDNISIRIVTICILLLVEPLGCKTILPSRVGMGLSYDVEDREVDKINFNALWDVEPPPWME